MDEYLLDYDFSDTTFYVNPSNNNNYFFTDFLLFKSNGVNPFSLSMSFSFKNNISNICDSYFNLSVFNRLEILNSNSLKLTDSYGNSKTFVLDNGIYKYKNEQIEYDSTNTSYIYSDKFNNKMYFNLGNYNYVNYPYKIIDNNIEIYLYFNSNRSLNRIDMIDYKLVFLYENNLLTTINVISDFISNTTLTSITLEYQNDLIKKIIRRLNKYKCYEFDYSNDNFKISSNDYNITFYMDNTKIEYIESVYEEGQGYRLLEKNTFLYDTYKTTIYDNIEQKYLYVNYDSNYNVKYINYDRRYFLKYEYDNNSYLLSKTSIFDIKEESLINSLSSFNVIPYEDEEETYDFNVTLQSGQTIPNLNIDVNQIYKIEGCGNLVLNKDIYLEKDENLKILLIAKKDNGWFSMTVRETQNMSYVDMKFLSSIDNFYEIYMLELKTKKYIDNIEISISVDGLSYIADLKLFKGDIGTYYTYDNNYNITKIESNNTILEYTYNLNNQLIKEESSETNISIGYVYDGNIIQTKLFLANNKLMKYERYSYSLIDLYKITEVFTYKVCDENNSVSYDIISYNGVTYYGKPESLLKFTYKSVIISSLLIENDIIIETKDVEYKDDTTIYNYQNESQIKYGNKITYEYLENTKLKSETNYFLKYEENTLKTTLINKKEYTYDNSNNQLIKSTINEDESTSINYNYVMDRISKLTHNNEYNIIYDNGYLKEVKYNYDSLDSITILNLDYYTNNNLVKIKNKFKFEYDNNNNNRLSYIKKVDDTILYSFTYDNIDRLISDSIYTYTYDENISIKTYNNKQYIEYKNGYYIDKLSNRISNDPRINEDMHYNPDNLNIINNEIDTDIYVVRSNEYYKIDSDTSDFYPLQSDFYNIDYSKYPINIKDNEVGYNEFVYDKDINSYVYHAKGSCVEYKYESTDDFICISLDMKLENTNTNMVLLDLLLNKIVVFYIYNNNGTKHLKLKVNNTLNDSFDILLTSNFFNVWHNFIFVFNGWLNYLKIDGTMYYMQNNTMKANPINYIKIGNTSRYGLSYTQGLIKNLFIKNTLLDSYKEIKKTYKYDIKNELKKEIYYVNQRKIIEKNYNYTNNIDNYVINYQGNDECILHNINYGYNTNLKGYLNKKVIYGENSSQIFDKVIDYYYDDYNRLILENNNNANYYRRYFYDSNNNLSSIYLINRVNDIDDVKEYTINDIPNDSILVSNMTFDNIYNRLETFKISTGSSIYHYTNSDINVSYYDNTMLPYLFYNNNGFRMEFKYISSRLTEVIKTINDSTERVVYEYNVEGLRTKKSIYNGGILYEEDTYYYDNDSNLLLEEREINNTLYKIEYLYDNNELYGYTHNNEVYYYLKDNYGYIYGIINSSGKIIEQYYMDSFGAFNPDNYYNSDNTKRISTNDFTTTLNINRIIYKGYYYDSEIGMYYLKNRYYNPYTGLFLTPDNINYIDFNNHLNYNLYTYCLNNPVMFSDPDGYVAGIIIGAIIGALVCFGAATYIDYKDDGQAFNGSVAWYDYLGMTALGAGVGAFGVWFSGLSFSFTIPGLSSISGSGAAAMSLGGITVTLSGTQVLTATGVLGITVMAAIPMQGAPNSIVNDNGHIGKYDENGNLIERIDNVGKPHYIKELKERYLPHTHRFKWKFIKGAWHIVEKWVWPY